MMELKTVLAMILLRFRLSFMARIIFMFCCTHADCIESDPCNPPFRTVLTSKLHLLPALFHERNLGNFFKL
jgi:hypothetical protein